MSAPNDLAQLAPLARLDETIAARKLAPASESYVASLLQAAAEKPLKKVAEEAAEFIMAASALSQHLSRSCAVAEGSADDVQFQATSGQLREKLIAEAADVQFHLQVALAHYNATLSDVAAVLSAREGVSGHAEKAARGKNT